MLKNTLKLFGNNFNLVWKQLLYLIIIGLITFGLASFLAWPVVDLIKSNGWFGLITDFVETIYTSPKQIADSFSELIKSLWHILSDNFAAYWVNYFLVVFVLFFISKMLYNLSYYAIAGVIEGKMTAFAKYSYTNKLICNLSKSIGYSFFQIIYSIPFFILSLVMGYFYGKLANNFISAFLLLPILVAIFVLIKALQITLFSGMIPSMIVDNTKSYKAFIAGMRVTSKRFARVFSSAIVLVLCQLLAIVFLGIFTIGTGLVIVIPALAVSEVLFSMVVYFSSTKNRYYLNENLIVNPL